MSLSYSSLLIDLQVPGASVQAFLSLAHSLGVSGFSEDAEAAEQDKENTVQVTVVNNIP